MTSPLLWLTDNEAMGFMPESQQINGRQNEKEMYVMQMECDWADDDDWWEDEEQKDLKRIAKIS